MLALRHLPYGAGYNYDKVIQAFVAEHEEGEEAGEAASPSLSQKSPDLTQSQLDTMGQFLKGANHRSSHFIT